MTSPHSLGGKFFQRRYLAAKKQELRDVTKDALIASAATPEELKAVIPDVLK